MSLNFDAHDLEDARRANRLLAFAPRLRFDSPLGVAMGRLLIRLLEPVAGRAAAGSGVTFRQRLVTAPGGAIVEIREAQPARAPRGIVLDIHGGAWSMGRAQIDDAVNAERVKAGYGVVSVDYRLLPEHAMEDCLGDCEAAARWLLAQPSRLPVFITGESAGAHLAAMTLLRLKAARADLSRIAGAVLFYGAYDLAGTPSMRAADRDTLVLHGLGMQRAAAHLVPSLDADALRSPDISPLYADLSGLPPALFIVGTRDPLIDDSRLMAQRWRGSGNAADLVVVPEGPHGFNRLPTRMAAKTNAHARDWMRAHLP